MRYQLSSTFIRDHPRSSRRLALGSRGRRASTTAPTTAMTSSTEVASKAKGSR